MENRLYSNRSYYISRPPNKLNDKKRKYWIYLAVISMFILLIGIILLVIFLVPKHKFPGMTANHMYGMFTTKLPSQRPFRPSVRDPILYDIDPRSDLDKNENDSSTSSSIINLNQTDVNLENETSTTSLMNSTRTSISNHLKNSFTPTPTLTTPPSNSSTSILLNVSGNNVKKIRPNGKFNSSNW